MSDPTLETALHDMEATASNFALRYARMAEVRVAYVQQIREMSQSLRVAVQAGEISAQKAAEVANQMRNQIMEMQRLRDFDLGRSLARARKAQGLALEQAIAKAMKHFGWEGKAFESLTGAQQRDVYLRVIERSGHSQPAVTNGIPRMRWASRGLWLATFAIAAYNIGTAENPWWQTGRESANIAGGVAGGFAGGAAMGAAIGIWGGPVGVAVGVLVGGALGALLADHAYVESAGTADPMTRSFVARFTGFWTGVDEEGLVRALVTEHRTNPAFVERVFRSLDDSYHTDADDVAVLYVEHLRRDPALAQALSLNPSLRALLVKLMDEGYTDAGEARAIQWVRAL